MRIQVVEWVRCGHAYTGGRMGMIIRWGTGGKVT